MLLHVAHGGIAGDQHADAVIIAVHQQCRLFEERDGVRDALLAERQERDLLVHFPRLRIEPHGDLELSVGLVDQTVALEIARLDAIGLGQIRVD